MIEVEPLKGTSYLLRIITDVEADTISASLVLEFEEPGTAWIKGFVGKMNRQTLRELLAALRSLNVKTVLAIRGKGHVLPMGVTGEDNITRVDIEELSKRA